MTIDGYEPSKLFTPDEVNAMLPLIKLIARDLSQVSRELMERQERLALLHRRGRGHKPQSFRDELTQIESEYDALRERYDELVNELVELGAEPKNGIEGLIDFPCQMDDRLVYLCWKLGEPELMYWHELDGGFDGRQPLAAETVSGGRDPQGVD